MPKSNSRQQLLEAAAELFYRDGFRATGVDTIAAVSGMGKMTLYRHFATKDDLIAAYLEQSNQHFWEWFEKVTGSAETPRQKILAFFAALEKMALTPTCHGCPFLNAAVDFPDPTQAEHRVALEHKNAVRTRFRELAAQAELCDPDQLADHLLLLMDGAFMAARMYGVQNPAGQVTKAVQILLDAAKKSAPP